MYFNYLTMLLLINMTTTTELQGTITIKLIKQQPTVREFKAFQQKHYTKRLADELATPVMLRCEKQWEAISYLRKRVNEFNGIFFNPQTTF